MTLIYFLIVIGILVFVHELGHFVMAKRAGVRVEKFSLGFGPKLFGFKKGDTEYLISALPLGGYVKMAGENPDEAPTGSSDEFQSKTVWQRMGIGVAGPLTNIVLAFMIMPIVYMIGTYSEGPAKVGYVESNSPAERAGFASGDVIKKINGRTINDWTKAITLIAVNPETDVEVVVDRQGEKKTFTLHPATATEMKIGTSGLVPDVPAEIGRLRPGLPAEKAGLQVNDKIISVDGKTIYHWNQFSLLIRDGGGKTVSVLIERNGTRIKKTVTPIMDNGRYVIGIEPILKLVLKKHDFFESLSLGFNKTIDFIDLTFITLQKLLTFDISIKTLGGPVMIAQMSGQAAAAGLATFLSLLAMISISLGILNLLPIPVLDGGLILFLLIEAVRGKPLPRRTMEIAQSMGAAILIMLIAVVSYNDIMRMFFNK
ncbi:MAG: RIP metalloprotease RseP [Nitrospirota bacterium]